MLSIGSQLEHMRERAPLVQNITNFVAMNPMANVMLAAGASPAMIHSPEESPEFMQIADALTINIGTLSSAWTPSMLIAAQAAKQAQKPWVFDPAAVGASEYRKHVAQRLIACQPRVIRGNASEILILAQEKSQAKGADSGDSVDAAQQAARHLADEQHCIVAVTGETDFITDGAQSARVSNGDAMMPRVTALGCSLTGIVAAFIAANSDAFAATVAALAYYGIAGEIAAAKAQGPGTFQIHFIDALYQITPAQLETAAKVEL